MQDLNCRWLTYDRNTKVSLKLYDFIFNNLESYLSCRQIMLPSLKKSWNIALVNLSEQEIVELCRTHQEDFNYLDIYATKDTLKRCGKFTMDKTNWSVYMDMLGSLDTPIATDAMYELYYGCKASLELIEFYLKKIVEQSPLEITKHLVNKYVISEFRVYPNDVLCSLFIYGNTTIILSADSPLKRYTRSKCVSNIDHLVRVLGNRRAYYSVRKAISKLYTLKLKYLRGEEIPRNSDRSLLELCKVVDVYSILWAYMFTRDGASKDAFSLLLINERGKFKDVSVYTKKFIADYTRHIYFTST